MGLFLFVGSMQSLQLDNACFKLFDRMGQVAAFQFDKKEILLSAWIDGDGPIALFALIAANKTVINTDFFNGRRFRHCEGEFSIMLSFHDNGLGHCADSKAA